ncbi:MAG TPA: hypothetical protein VKH18_13380 [Terriglobales bacterium]|nr:hypothetical protein [Terriglobales bacterium]
MNDDLVKCPLCGGLTHIEKPELLAALNDPKIRERVENYVAELLRPSSELQRDFNKNVHNWNPAVPIWQRSPKE